jgi:hypothetical protein
VLVAPARGEARRAGLRSRASAAEVAWLATIPCALVLAAIVVLLGPPLGRALFDRPVPAYWSFIVAEGFRAPEPTEHSRFLLALAGPLLLVGATALGTRRLPSTTLTRALALGAQAALLLAAAGCLVAQHELRSVYDGWARRTYFSWSTLAVAAALAIAGAAFLRRAPLAERLRPPRPESALLRRGALAAAVLATALWLLPAVNTEASVSRTNVALFVNLPFWLDESFGVLNGLAPLADFQPQYAHLWPYVGAASMALFGASLTVYALTMVSATAAAMVAVYALLRRVVRRSLLALALFLPFLATSFFTDLGPPGRRWGPVDAFSMFPMRYGGPYLLAWLTVRHLDGARPRRRTPLFLAAWLVAVNNLEFGLPALGATLAALLWTAGRPTWRAAGRLALELAGGLAGAALVVTALTLTVAGSLPDPDLGKLLIFARLYGVHGFANLPISPTIGVHLAIYATFVAAIAVASVRALEGSRAPALTGALVWSGVFGLGASAYFAGRSHPSVLISLFSPWALALSLLAVVAVRGMAGRRSPLPTPAELAVLFGLGIAACSLAQVPVPWREAERLAASSAAPALRPLAQERFIARRTHPGERIAILGPLGHRIAYDVGVSDVMPYATLESMPTRELFVEMLDRLARERVRKAFLILVPTTTEEHVAVLEEAGFAERSRSRDVIELLRTGAPH